MKDVLEGGVDRILRALLDWRSVWTRWGSLFPSQDNRDSILLRATPNSHRWRWCYGCRPSHIGRFVDAYALTTSAAIERGSLTVGVWPITEAV